MIQEITEFRYFTGKFVTKFGSESTCTVRGEYNFPVSAASLSDQMKG